MISERSRRTISSIYDAALAANLWPAALQSAMDEVGAVGAGHSVFNKRTERVEWLSSRVFSSAGRRITSAIITNSTVTDRYSRPFRLGDGCGFPSACPKPYSVATNTRHVSGLDTPRHISNSVFPGSPPLSSVSRRSLADRGSRLSRFSIRRRPYFHPANLLQRADNAVGQTACPAVCTSWTSGTSRSWGGI
jgi:hypothetical protein